MGQQQVTASFEVLAAIGFCIGVGTTAGVVTGVVPGVVGAAP